MRVGTTAAHTSGGSCKNENENIGYICDETYAVTIKQEESWQTKTYYDTSMFALLPGYITRKINWKNIMV